MAKTWHRKLIRHRPMAAGKAKAVLPRPCGWEHFLDLDVARVAREAEPVFVPAFDILETDRFFGILADLPGIRQEDLEITRTASRITVAGVREPESWGDGANYYALERTFGVFSRSFSLPAGACPDQTCATLKDGVLTVMVPKTPALESSRIPLQDAIPVLKRA
jgi:HSP20 family protein